VLDPLGHAGWESLWNGWVDGARAAAGHWIVTFLLVASRIGGLVAIGPVFGHPDLPAQLRVLLVLALSVVVAPSIAAQKGGQTFARLDRDGDGRLTVEEVPAAWRPQVEAALKSSDGLREAAVQTRLPPPAPGTLLEFAGLVAVEFGLGLALALGVLTIVSGLQMAGSLIDQQIGVSLGEVFNPEFEVNSSMSGQALHQLGMVLFLVVGGHVLLVNALLNTFDALPVGYAWLTPEAVDMLRDLVHQSLELAVRVSAPIMGAMAVVGLAMGVLGHTIPQINVLVVGFPVRALVGMFILTIAMAGTGRLLSTILPLAIDHCRLVLAGG
jgi:flagellar biosynthetic protein FliR